MSTVRIVVEDNPSAADLERIQDALDEHNMAITGRRDWGRVTVFLRDEREALVGGIVGEWWAGWLHVRALWVSEPFRKRQYGRRLLTEGERIAAAKGCRGVFLETFSFQAPDFYRKNGYRELGRLDGYPPGHAHLCFWKPLSVGGRS